MDWLFGRLVGWRSRAHFNNGKWSLGTKWFSTQKNIQEIDPINVIDDPFLNEVNSLGVKWVLIINYNSI